MKISLITLFPELYTTFCTTSLVGRASEKGLAQINVVSMIDYVTPRKRIDGPTFGHGPGMLIRPEVVEQAIESQENVNASAFKIFFSPHGKKITQTLLKDMYARIQARGSHCMMVAARYEGIDARVEEFYADEIISIGDFVLMGGDLPAMMLTESLLRYVPGVVGREASVEEDSFSGPFVDCPHYTAPVVWKGYQVPEVLRSGNHAAMESWRRAVSIERTVAHHFDWVRSQKIAQKDKIDVAKTIPAHYVALMHSGVMLADGNREGNSSVTSIDVHDIARSARTFGVRHYFVVTELLDQQAIVNRLLYFWQDGAGVTYRESRHEALKEVSCIARLQAVIEEIEQREGKRPLVIVTSAKEVAEQKNITYYDQERVWAEKRPVLILFGTAHGLGPSIIDQCDYVLTPIEGFSSFNHLSVRSAAAIVLDRWLGINIKND